MVWNKRQVGPTEFLGYEYENAEAVIQKIIKKNKEVENLKDGEEGIIILNQTPFYGESGGQVGDSGTIKSGESIFEVNDVQKKLGNLLFIMGN